MGILSQLPEWLGTALFAAVAATIGFFGQNLWKWWSRQHETKRQRRVRLEQLDRLLDESGNLFRSQRDQAQRLLESLQRSQPSVTQPGLSLDQIFSRGFANFSSEEAQLHAIIRGVTETAMRRVNEDMAEWLRDDDWFKQPQDKSEDLVRLSHELQRLELHLNEWQAKFSSLFPKNESLALNYLADEQEQATGFPTGIEALVKRVLKELP